MIGGAGTHRFITLPTKPDRERLLLDNNQHRLFALKTHAVGRKSLLELATIVMPRTIAWWRRELMAKTSF